MKEFLMSLTGRKIDVICTGGVGVRGEVVAVDNDVLHLKDEQEHICYVAIDKVTVVWDAKDNTNKMGFKIGLTGKS